MKTCTHLFRIALALWAATSGLTAGMPRPVVEKFNSALVSALQDPAIHRELLDSGAVPVGNTPEQHAAYIKAEIEKWRKVANEAGISPE